MFRLAHRAESLDERDRAGVGCGAAQACLPEQKPRDDAVHDAPHRREQLKSFPPVADLLKTFTENGGKIGVCPPCGKTHGVTDENILPNAEWLGAAAVLAAAQDRQAFSF